MVLIEGSRPIALAVLGPEPPNVVGLTTLVLSALEKCEIAREGERVPRMEKYTIFGHKGKTSPFDLGGRKHRAFLHPWYSLQSTNKIKMRLV